MSRSLSVTHLLDLKYQLFFVLMTTWLHFVNLHSELVSAPDTSLSVLTFLSTHFELIFVVPTCPGFTRSPICCYVISLQSCVEIQLLIIFYLPTFQRSQWASIIFPGLSWVQLACRSRCTSRNPLLYFCSYRYYLFVVVIIRQVIISPCYRLSSSIFR